MAAIKYSIIIPHKNSFNSLLKLLSTIPTRMDLEVIVVDDFSIDEDKKRLKSHSFNENVKLIFSPSEGGAGKARNYGLDVSEGKWILFADSDDYFSDEFENIVDEYYSSTEDIIYFGTTSIFSNNLKPAYRHQRYIKLVSDFITGKPGSENGLRYFFTPPWGKMIRNKIIKDHNIRFDEIIASNDVMFSLKTAFYATSIKASPKTLYIITTSSGSLTNTFSQEHFTARFETALCANDFLCSISKKKYQQSVLYFIANSYKLGVNNIFYVFKKILKHRSNLLIGMGKVFKYKEVMNKRENKEYLNKKIN